MVRGRWIVLMATLVAASALARPPGWAGQCYAEFADDVSRLAGPSAVDCGFIPPGGSSAQQKQVVACAKKAVANGRPFKFGYHGAGDDSSYCDAAVRTPSGELVNLFYDFDTTGQNGTGGVHARKSVSRCSSIAWEPGLIDLSAPFPHSFYRMEGCGRTE